jgi:hypothetical protein
MVRDCWVRVGCGGMTSFRGVGRLRLGCVAIVTLGIRASAKGYERSGVGGRAVGAVNV